MKKVMKNVLLSDWFKQMHDSEIESVVEGMLREEGHDDSFIESYRKFTDEFFKFEGEDREIELNDLRNDDGILYKKMCEYNENELVIECGVNMLWYEYSIEDYFRDTFNKDDVDSWFKLFSLREINSVLYKDYNDDDWSYDD